MKWWLQVAFAILIGGAAVVVLFFLMLSAVMLGTNEENTNPEACRDVGGTPAVQSGVLLCVIIQQPDQGSET